MNDERLASACKLAECDSIIGELCSDKQQLVEHTVALEKEVCRLCEELMKEFMRTECQVSELEGDDLPELESTTKYPSDSDCESTVNPTLQC